MLSYEIDEIDVKTQKIVEAVFKNDEGMILQIFVKIMVQRCFNANFSNTLLCAFGAFEESFVRFVT